MFTNIYVSIVHNYAFGVARWNHLFILLYLESLHRINSMEGLLAWVQARNVTVMAIGLRHRDGERQASVNDDNGLFPPPECCNG